MRTVMIALALLLMLPLLSLGTAAARGGHAGMGAGGVAGLPVVAPFGIHGFGHPDHQGFFRGSHVQGSRVNPVIDGTRMAQRRVPRIVSPPLIIELRGNRFERIVQTNLPVTGPLIIERQGDTFVRIR